MHATLETTDDRNRLVSHASNREVLGHLAAHVAEVMEEQATLTTPRRALELLAGVENADPELRGLGFVDTLIAECAGRFIFPRLDKTLNSSANVYQVPHSTWLSQLSCDVFPEVLAVDPTDALSGLLRSFKLSWFDSPTLKKRLRQYLLSVDRRKAGEILGRLLADGQLIGVGAGGLLIGADGKLIDDGDCFFTPVEKLPTLPAWALYIRFVDEEFQSGLLRGAKAGGLRFLSSDLSRCDGEVDEYRFDTVGRALIDQVERGSDADAPAHLQRWRELLRWLFDASPGSRQVLTQLSIKVVTGRGTLRRATTCYLGSDYPRGQVVWRLYKQFDQDEFVGPAADCGLGGLATQDVEEFLVAIGVNPSPRFEALRSGSDYQRFERAVVERINYPRTIRDRNCENADELRSWCTSYEIEGLRLPDRWMKLLTEGDPAAVVAFLISSGGPYLTDERDSQAKFQATVESERVYRPDASVPIPNQLLFFLREIAWVPAPDGRRRRPSEIMLSNQGVRVLRGVFSRHAVDPKDRLIAAHGGREALESLLTRLGAVSSLENLNGQSLYELLQALPECDPSGEVAPGIYRTLIDSSITADESPHRERFLKAGRMWGRYKSVASYLPVNELRYNANLTVTKAIETHIPLVDIPRRKSTQMVKQLFGISSLTSEEIVLTLESEGTEYDPGSEDANQHLHIAMPCIYALRLARTLDERGRELGLLRKAALLVCIQARVSARLPGDVTEIIVLTEPGERIVVDTSLVVVGDYRENGPGFLTFWLSAAELVAELLGTDVADEVGGILRCRTPAEMLEVVRVRLGSDADRKLSEAKARFDNASTDGSDEADYPIPSPKPTDETSPAPQPAQPSPPSIPAGSPGSGATGGSDLTSGAGGTFQPIAGPSERTPKRRKLVVTGAGGGGGGGGPLATEDVTFKVVDAFERHEGRFIIPVGHLHGSDGFGCDLLSVACEAIRDKALTETSINDTDIERYIEVKGRRSRTGEVEISDNEYRAAQRRRERYWLYRVFVDPLRAAHYEVAVLSDPLNSNAVRQVTRFNLAQGSGASWYSMAETVEEEPSV